MNLGYLGSSCLLFLSRDITAQNNGNASKLSNKLDKVVAGFYPAGHPGKISPDRIPYSNLTHTIYTCAALNKGYKIEIKDSKTLEKIVRAAHKEGVKVIVSMDGKDYDSYLSKMLATTNRNKYFTHQLNEIVDKYNLDGIDLQWHHTDALYENSYKRYVDNLAHLLKELRNSLKDKLITLSIHEDHTLYPEPNAMSKLPQYVDFLNLIVFDFYSGEYSEMTGPIAPLYSNIERSASYDQIIQNWVASGFPKNKLVVGIPFYGVEYVTKQDILSLPENMYQDKDQIVKENTTFWFQLRTQNVLSTPVTAGPGWQRFWDNNTKTPWLINNKAKTFISYEDPESIEHKVKYIKDQQLKGLLTYSPEFDNGELIKEVAKLLINDISDTKTKSSSSLVSKPSALTVALIILATQHNRAFTIVLGAVLILNPLKLATNLSKRHYTQQDLQLLNLDV